MAITLNVPAPSAEALIGKLTLERDHAQARAGAYEQMLEAALVAWAVWEAMSGWDALRPPATVMRMVPRTPSVATLDLDKESR